MNPTLQIDHLKLTLPPQWQGKAQLFARYLSHRLSTLELKGDRHIDRLELPPMTAQAGESYQVVARRVARQIGEQINALPATRQNTVSTPRPIRPNRTNNHA